MGAVVVAGAGEDATAPEVASEAQRVMLARRGDTVALRDDLPVRLDGLKRVCRRYGLSVGGRKGELQDRIIAHLLEKHLDPEAAKLEAERAELEKRAAQ